ncbi:MAG TPA: HD domain-containing phosphohydrolase [Pyrinomonadaceae bacterium]|nr:HD domain-containing phosphohydrolase [Pyrinomonadaceae bacterium]
MPQKIMVVDNEPADLRRLERLLGPTCQVLSAASGDEALRLLEQHDVALLITELRLPCTTGAQLLAHAAELRPHMVRIILTAHADADALADAINRGQVYRYATKPWNDEDIRLTVARALQHYEAARSRHEAEETNKRLARRLRAMTRGVVRAIADTLEAKDRHVYGHARRVAGYATAIGRRMRLSTETLEQISLAALLHDVGKISTPDSILLKPAALTDEERAVVRLHSERGARLLAAVPEMEEVAAGVRHHHENWDGTGYPEGLAGERIPLASRVIHVADAYDALTSPRPFRDALEHERAVSVLKEGAGTQFDPEVVAAFCGLDALSQIRGRIARGDFGSGFLPVPRPAALRVLPLEELVRVVEREPALAASVLRAANAGLRAEEATMSLYAACERLGAEHLREHIVQGDEARRRCHEAELLCDHSRRCAAAAMLLAERTGAVDPDEAYTAGLLHDLGEALLRSLFSEEADNITWLGHPFTAEKEVAAFGVDHAQVGQWILDACGVPATLSFAVQAHHDIEHVNDPAAILLQVADAVASVNDSSEMAGLEALAPERLALLRLTLAEVARIQERTNEIVSGRFYGVAA